MKEVEVLNIKIATVSKSGLKTMVKTFLTSDSQRKIGKVNTEFLLRTLEKKEFERALDECDINIADGKGVLWAAKYLNLPLTKIPFLSQIQAIWQMVYTGASLVFYPKYCRSPIPENIPGLDAIYLMLEVADEVEASVYFFGAEPNVLPEAVKKIQEKYPKLNITGYHDGYDYKDADIIKEINESRAKLLIVAMGSPKQEYWIRDNLDELEVVRIAVGEGGSLDRIAGEAKSAPKWMQKVSIEWVWRLFTDKNRTGIPGERPKRRGRRVWNAVPVFIYNVVKFKITNPLPSKDTKG